MDQFFLSLMIMLQLSTSVEAQSLHPTFERSLQDESELQKTIVDGILDIQKKNTLPNGLILRGTHSKGICSNAEFEVYNSAQSGNPDLHVGLFSQPATYPATVRFANAASKIQDDQEPDVRSLSFSVENIPAALSNSQGRIDFSTNNATTFPINDAQVFADLMTISMEGKFFGSLKVGLGLLDLLEVGNLAAAQQKPASLPFQKMRYWSGVPFLLGQERAMKYALTPCPDNAFKPLNKKDPNSLNNEFTRHLKSDAQMSCFYFQVQVLDANKLTDAEGFAYETRDWIENATWEWSEEQIPFITLAKLTLTNSSFITTEDCEKLRFNVNKNTSAQHRGLGSINRARTKAEQASAQNRP